MGVVASLFELIETPSSKKFKNRYGMHIATPQDLYGRHVGTREEVHRILKRENYSALEDMWNGYWASQERMDSGSFVFSAMTGWVTEFYADNGGNVGRVNALLKAYETHPTVFFSALLGEAFFDLGSEERGDEWAKDVAPNQWNGFHSGLEVAADVLMRHAEEGQDNYLWNFSFYLVAFYGGASREVSNAAYERLFELAPSCYSVLATRGIGLLPRWSGTSPGDVDEFARTAMVHTRNELGRGAYAMVHSQFTNMYALEAHDTAVDPALLEAACMDLIERFPGQYLKMQAASLMIWVGSDNGLAKVFNSGLNSVDKEAFNLGFDKQAMNRLVRALLKVEKASKGRGDAIELRQS